MSRGPWTPPPGWPVPPEGWEPQPGWHPEPEWGPAPEGWNFYPPQGSGMKDKMAERLRQANTAAQQAAKAKIEARRLVQSPLPVQPSPAASPTAGALFVGQSHEAGRNATVTLYADRLERVKHKKMGSLSRAKQDVEVTPVRAISSVQAKKDTIINTKVTVYASGNNIEFRFGHGEARRFAQVLTKLMLEGSSPAPVVVPQGAAAPDLADQLVKMAALRDQGILTEEEFVAQKAKLLS